MGGYTAMLRLALRFIAAALALEAVVLGGLLGAQWLSAVTGAPLPSFLQIPRIAEVLASTLGFLNLLEDPGRATIVRNLAEHPRLTVAAFLLTPALPLSASSPFQKLARRLLPDPPQHLVPRKTWARRLKRRPVEPAGRAAEAQLLRAFTDGPERIALYGLCGNGQRARRALADHWLRNLSAGWDGFALEGPPPAGWLPKRRTAILVEAHEDDEETWRWITALLDVKCRLRILVNGSLDFDQIEDRLDDLSLRDKLRAILPQAIRVRTAPSGPGQPGSAQTGGLKLERSRSNLSPGGTLRQAEERPDTSSTFLSIGWRASDASIPSTSGDDTPDIRRDAAELIRKAVKEFQADGLKVLALTALWRGAPLPAALRAKIAPSAGDRVRLKGLFSDDAFKFRDETDDALPIFFDPQLADEVLLRTLSRLQVPDRAEVLDLVGTHRPADLHSMAARLAFEHEHSEDAVSRFVLDADDYAAEMLSGPYDDREVGGYRDRVKVTASALEAGLRAPGGADWAQLCGLTHEVRQLALAHALDDRCPDKKGPLDALAKVQPADRLELATLADHPVWRRHPRATAAVIDVLTNYNVAPLAERVGADDPSRAALEALDVMNIAYQAFDRPLSEEERGFLTTGQARLQALLRGADPVERMSAAWAANWIANALIIDAPVVEPEPGLIAAMVEVAGRADIELPTWKRAAHALGKLAGGPIDGTAAAAPPLSPPPGLEKDAMANAMARAAAILDDVAATPAAKRAAAFLTLAYEDDPKAARVAVAAAAEPELGIGRQVPYLIRLIQNGGPHCLQALVEGFRQAPSDEARRRFYQVLSMAGAASRLSTDEQGAGGRLRGDQAPAFHDLVMATYGHLIHKLKAKDTTGRWAYYFVLVTKQREAEFLASIEGNGVIDLEDYGKVVASCYGEQPTEEVKQHLKTRYGFDV
jgi:hypothetical protein